ncbi:MAG: hypothetical protein FJ296_10780, partial [Planctomycetes bacterium]|nr:hypothetical protein [Planctomycetota bacterium]
MRSIREGWRVSAGLVVLLVSLAPACGGAAPGASATAAGAPSLLHLADALDGARVSASPALAREARAWTFDQPRPEWLPQGRELSSRLAQVSLERLPDATRLLLRRPEGRGGMLMGGLVAPVDAGPLQAWSGVRVRARTHERLSGITVVANVHGEQGLPGRWVFMMGGEASVPVFGDGSVQDYLLPLKGSAGTTLDTLGVFVGAPGEGSLDILAVTLVPRGAEFGLDAGVLAVARGGESRHALYAHAPASLAFRVRVPAG